MELRVELVQRRGGRPHGYERITALRLVRDTGDGEEAVPLLAVAKLTSPEGALPPLLWDGSRVQLVRGDGAYVMVWTVL